MTTTNDVTKLLDEAEGRVPTIVAPRKTAVEELLGEFEPPRDMPGFAPTEPISFSERQSRKDAALQGLISIGIERQMHALAAELQRHGFWAEAKHVDHQLLLGFVPTRGTPPAAGDERNPGPESFIAYGVAVVSRNAAGDVQAEILGPREVVVPIAMVTQELVLAGFKDCLRWAIKNARKKAP